jgi:hypothetical protein
MCHLSTYAQTGSPLWEISQLVIGKTKSPFLGTKFPTFLIIRNKPFKSFFSNIVKAETICLIMQDGHRFGLLAEYGK